MPNAISAARLLATPALLVSVVVRGRSVFTWLLLALYISDILDGLIARIFKVRSRMGAFLDSTADMVVLVIALSGVAVFEHTFLRQHAGTLAALAVMYLAEIVWALLRYGRISSFHTIASRLAAYAQGIFLISLFLWGYREWLFAAMAALAAVALAEEMALLYVFPQWRSDVRGLYWVLRAEARDTSRSAGQEAHHA